MSHSVHLNAPPPDAGPFFESRSAQRQAALSPATPPSISSDRKRGRAGFKKGSPAEAGQGLSWKENQDEASATHHW
jgi:hypothetical protein